MKHKNLIILFLFASSLVAAAQQDNEIYRLTTSPSPALEHSFFDRQNLRLQSVNVFSETMALLAIQSHDDGMGMAPCHNYPAPAPWRHAAEPWIHSRSTLSPTATDGAPSTATAEE